MKDQAVLKRTNDNDVLALMHGRFRDGGGVHIRYGLREQRLRSLSSFFGDRKIRGVVIDGINLAEFDELDDLHGGGRARLQFFQFLGFDQNVFIFFDLIAHGDFIARHDLLVVRTIKLLMHARSALLMNFMEGNL